MRWQCDLTPSGYCLNPACRGGNLCQIVLSRQAQPADEPPNYTYANLGERLNQSLAPELPRDAEGRPGPGAAVERRQCLPNLTAGPEPSGQVLPGPAAFSEGYGG